MADIRLVNINKSFEKEEVISNLNLTIKDGSFTVLVGPSGCGKSTTLRMIAGLEAQTSGDIWIGDQLVNDVSPGDRNVAMVFQNYALYPTMNVRENIEFGLKNNKVPKAEREKLIKDISEIVGLTPYLNKKPQNLSGGQRQRVALARAMVKKPEVFILDEPLSNLDAKLRHQMRTELIELHQRLGTTFVYVTHDQVEAMSMGDEIVMMNLGEIQQIADPLTIYHNPKNLFAAQFIGTPAMNIVSYEKIASFLGKNHPHEIHKVGVRPEKISIERENTSKDIQILGEVMTTETLGAEIIYQVSTEAGLFYVKNFLKPLHKSKKVFISINKDDLYFFDSSGNRLRQYEGFKQETLILSGV